MKRSNDFIPVVYEDDEIIVVNKAATLAAQSDRTGDPDLIQLLQDEQQKQLFLINRLDRPVSGAMILAKSKEVQKYYQLKTRILKSYLAVVPKLPFSPSLLENYLKRDGRSFKAREVSPEDPGGRPVKLYVTHFMELENFQVVKISLYKGFFHQIRCQLSLHSMPIRGDVKYGARRANEDRSIDLHALYVHIPEKNILAFADINRSDSIWSAISRNPEIRKPAFGMENDAIPIRD